MQETRPPLCKRQPRATGLLLMPSYRLAINHPPLRHPQRSVQIRGAQRRTQKHTHHKNYPRNGSMNTIRNHPRVVVSVAGSKGDGVWVLVGWLCLAGSYNTRTNTLSFRGTRGISPLTSTY